MMNDMVVETFIIEKGVMFLSMLEIVAENVG
jgi:hypothetical protein